MKFLKGRIITKIQIPIVRICNKQCPHCCAKQELTWFNKSITEKEISIDELYNVGSKIGEIDEIEITGGEPTLHSKFEEITNNLTNIFNCKKFMLVSNGWVFKKHPLKLPLLLRYETVWITHYTKTFVSNYGGVDNDEECEIIKDFLNKHGKPHWGPVKMDAHVPFKSPPYGGNPCGHYHSNMVSYYEGNLYGCCVAWSLSYKGRGIPLTLDWRNDLENIDLPCEHCFLST